jgi:hypothetical protein
MSLRLNFHVLLTFSYFFATIIASEPFNQGRMPFTRQILPELGETLAEDGQFISTRTSARLADACHDSPIAFGRGRSENFFETNEAPINGRGDLIEGGCVDGPLCDQSSSFGSSPRSPEGQLSLLQSPAFEEDCVIDEETYLLLLKAISGADFDNPQQDEGAVTEDSTAFVPEKAVVFGQSHVLEDTGIMQCQSNVGSNSQMKFLGGGKVSFPVATSRLTTVPRSITGNSDIMGSFQDIPIGTATVGSDRYGVNTRSYSSSVEESIEQNKILSTVKQGRVLPTVKQSLPKGVGSGLKYQKEPSPVVSVASVKPHASNIAGQSSSRNLGSGLQYIQKPFSAASVIPAQSPAPSIFEQMLSLGVGAGLPYQQKPFPVAFAVPARPHTSKEARPQKASRTLARAASSPGLDHRDTTGIKPQAKSKIDHIFDSQALPPDNFNIPTMINFRRRIIAGPSASEKENAIIALFGDHYLRLGHDRFVISDAMTVEDAQPLESLQQYPQSSRLPGTKARVFASINDENRLDLRVTGQPIWSIILLRVKEDGYYNQMVIDSKDLTTSESLQADDLVLLTYSHLINNLPQMHGSVNPTSIALAFLDASNADERFVMVLQIGMVPRSG